MTNNDSVFKWYSSDLELLAYFKHHPYFSDKYKRTAVRLDEREDFKVICNIAGRNLPRLQPDLHRKLYNIIVKYAKLNLLISRGQVSEKEVVSKQCISEHIQKKLHYLKVFVSGFTDVDIPQAIHDYYDILFKVNAYVGPNTGVSLDELNAHYRKIKKSSENVLHEMDMKFINNKIRQSFKEPYEKKLTSCETQIFQTLGIDYTEVKKRRRKQKTREVSVREPMCTILPNNNKKITNSFTNIVEIIDSDDDVEDTLRNNIPNHPKVAEVPESMCYVFTHANIKKEINDSEMDVEQHSVSNDIGEGTSMNNIPSYTYVIPPEFAHSTLPKINIKDSVYSILPNVNIKKEMNGSDMGTIGQDLGACQKVIDGNAMPNADYEADLNKYMKDIADYLCRILPMDKRRAFLSEVDVIVSQILEE